MHNFSLKIPTEIYFGTGVEEMAGRLISRFGKRIMVVYGSQRIFSDGLGRRVVNYLEAAGCQALLCGGVRPNGEVTIIEELIREGRKWNADGILAIGGGSVIDSAKAISVGFYYDGKVTDLYTDQAVPSNFLPLGAIVTIPATASESNGMSVIMDKGRKLSHFFEGAKPKFALLNPEFTLTVDAYQTAVGGFDVFSHAFERYFDLQRNCQLFDVMTEGLMKTVVQVLPRLVRNLGDIDLRSEIMLAATVAHNDMLGPGGDFACHQISHILTERYGVSHGGALAMIIPAWCEYMQGERPEHFARFYQSIWGETTLEGGIKELKSFISSLGLPLHIKADCHETQALAKRCVSPSGCVGGGFKPLTKIDVKRILEKIIIVA